MVSLKTTAQLNPVDTQASLGGYELITWSSAISHRVAFPPAESSGVPDFTFKLSRGIWSDIMSVIDQVR